MAGPGALLALLLATTTTIAPTKNSNGTTLPFQRHMVRVGPAQAGQGVLAAAVQKQGSDGEGLVLYRSTDGGGTWLRDEAIQPDASVRDTADLLVDPDGQGFSLAYSEEPHSSTWTVDTRFKVVFLHYKLLSDKSFAVDRGPVTVFSPASGQGYFRTSIARDSTGLLHCSASLFDGTNYSWLVRTSSDGGLTWSGATTLATFGGTFGGGRVLATGQRVIALFDSYDPSTPGRYRLRAAGAGGTWGDTITFATDGLYHAGAFSVTATPDGHVHLGYSRKSDQALRYREFDGTSWSSPLTIESVGYWSNQPALTHVGNDIAFSWNHEDSSNAMRIMSRPRIGGAWGSTTVVDDVQEFKGYTNAIEEVVAGEPVQVIWSQQDDVNNTQPYVRNARVAFSGGSSGGGTTTPPSTTSFSDTFDACTSTTDLGPNWVVDGRWYCQSGRARGEVEHRVALAKAALPANVQVEARVELTSSATGSGVVARAQSGNYYAARMLASGRIELVRVSAGSEVVLGQVAASVPTLSFQRLTLRVSGDATQVTLDVSYNRSPVLSVVDDSAQRLSSGSGVGLLSGSTARTQFDDFTAKGL